MLAFAPDQTQEQRAASRTRPEARFEFHAAFSQQVKSTTRTTACCRYLCRIRKYAEAGAQGKGDEQAI
jgi:hypothetical protein